MNPKRVVITGGPGTGKTSLVKSLEEDGFTCFHEIIRDLTSEAIEGRKPTEIASNPLAFVEDPHNFNQKLLTGRMEQFRQASSNKSQVVFFDRGMPDVLAYMDYFDQSYDEDFMQACLHYRYDLVMILPPWKDIYTSDGERFESFEEARAIHSELLRTYEKLNYSPIQVPLGSVSERHYFITELIQSFR